MNAQIRIDPIEANNRLEQLGLTREQLLEVVDAMVGARNSCTENDPPGAPGWKAWCDGTRRLREIGARLGWKRNDDGQISCTLDSKRGNKFAVCNTDEGTGRPDTQPQNRSKKGAATNWAILQNQGPLGNILEEALNVIPLQATANGVSYWYLCVYCEGDEVRAELTCPSVCEKGFFSEFAERIFLTGGDGDGGGVRLRRDGPDDGGNLEFEINVTRKQA